MVESTRGGGERNDPSSVNVSRFPDRNFDRIKEIVIYSVSLVRRYTRMVIQFSRVFPPALDRLSLDRSASGHFSPVQACDVEQTFAKPVKLASHFKVKSGPARGGTIDPN